MKYRYRKLSEYLKEKYGEKTLKICVDGKFTCPNRDGNKGTGGCIFCSEKGSGDHLEEISIKKQVENGLKYKQNRANKFIVYFQNYSNNYDSINKLRNKYNQALISDKIVCLEIATRPDCINVKICELLLEFKKKIDVVVELGLQTASDKTGEIINRKYSLKDFENAVKLLNKFEIECVAHIMVGLPYEKHEDIENTVCFLNTQQIQGIKIHSTYIVKGTELAKLYKEKIYKPLELEEYIKEACYIISNLKPQIVIHKISGDCPKDLLVAPGWNLHKKWIINGIEKYLNDNDLWQGKYYQKVKN